ncbi:MAG: hypothetical protein GY948_16330 [Alphaproteobacteria bacterium]|nr:hypothetical protein [Alphaproteobacteria bacterium]
MIRERFEDASIKATFKFIGIGLDERAMLELRQLAQAVNNPNPENYLNEAQLSAALRYYLEFQPAIDNVNAIADVLNGSLGLLDEAAKLIGQRNYEGAEEKIKAAEYQRKSTLKPYEDLARRRIDENFARVFEFAQRLREQQGRLVDVNLKNIITAKQIDDAETTFDGKLATFKQQEARFKQAQKDYNQAVGVVKEAQKDYNQAVALVKEERKAANKAINEYNRLAGEATGIIKRLRR